MPEPDAHDPHEEADHDADSRRHGTDLTHHSYVGPEAPSDLDEEEPRQDAGQIGAEPDEADRRQE